MTVEATTINSHTVYRDHEKTWRWYDVVGPKATKWTFDANNVVSTTTAAGCTVTQTNGTLVGLAGADGGAVVFTLGGADNDVAQVQAITEGFYFAARWPAYFGIKFKLVDADQTDLHAGLIITDTDMAGGVSDGLYFRLVDESAIMSLVLEKSSAESTSAVATVADATDITAEFYYDAAAGYVYAYINGVLAASVAVTDANWCNDEYLAPAIAVQAGEGSANHGTVYWARAFQIREAS